MRTFTLIIVLFIVAILFFEVTDWTPEAPTTKEVTTQKTIITETVSETGDVINATVTTEEPTQETPTDLL